MHRFVEEKKGSGWSPFKGQDLNETNLSLIMCHSLKKANKLTLLKVTK